ncbi:FecR domain-containing protein [Mucilaginibacter sp. SMC90]|uniref:FecR family protein n=1 Tax=Mucilaginibacter sp. SMC90 TaxID=2929803 RepID=UPI001FB1C401|nr:FecR domain-containing protein [Mucilaginibacter sp. SMC90]UOE46288.1 FecR domain-containing protein [Mucilaginibacter sp. SMC90]
MMEDLLTKYMLNETTPVENETINRWLSESEDNRKYFDHFKLIWDTSRELKIESKLDPEASWAEFKQLAQNRTEVSAQVRPLNAANRWLKIAAIWLAILGSAGILYTVLKPGKPNMLTLQSGNMVRKVTLADGSLITMNKNSVLNYPDRFTGDTREISLKGEAFFDVAHDKSKPFMIHVNDVVVKVVGTSFNIKTTGPNTEVIVETGVVQVIQQEIVVKLKPKEKASVQAGRMQKGSSQDELYNYYRTQKFVANKTPLWRLVDVLNEAYKVNIVIDNKKLANRTITTTFKADSLDNILKTVAETLGDVKVIKKPHLIIIK